ncbi:MAG TPA: AmmeMemoRadiSam system protein A [Nanoarchaeota archaeon]|nr:AmmeMemoRadiSam system protein A [Nanoarchaeota archaeon]
MEFEEYLLKLAKESIEKWVKERKELKIDIEKLPPKLKEKKGVFVTIYKIKNDKKELRGCIGFPYAILPLAEAVIKAAKEACEDPRFPPLSENELKEIVIEISLLSQPKRVEIENRAKLPEKLDKNKGYIIKRGFHSGLFLPQVWKELQDPEEFLANLCFKAGLPPDAWIDKNTEIYEFEAEIIEERR